MDHPGIGQYLPIRLEPKLGMEGEADVAHGNVPQKQMEWAACVLSGLYQDHAPFEKVIYLV